MSSAPIRSPRPVSAGVMQRADSLGEHAKRPAAVASDPQQDLVSALNDQILRGRNSASSRLANEQIPSSLTDSRTRPVSAMWLSQVQLVTWAMGKRWANSARLITDGPPALLSAFTASNPTWPKSITNAASWLGDSCAPPACRWAVSTRAWLSHCHSRWFQVIVDIQALQHKIQSRPLAKWLNRCRRAEKIPDRRRDLGIGLPAFPVQDGCDDFVWAERVSRFRRDQVAQDGLPSRERGRDIHRDISGQFSPFIPVRLRRSRRR